MDSNWLKVNASKTELILFGSKVQLNKGRTTHITVDGDKVEISLIIKYLSDSLDKNLSIGKYILLKCQKASYCLHNVSLIHHSLTLDPCKQVV